MKTKQVKKDFDAVKTMRSIRDKFSKEIMNMTFEEEKAYLKKLLANNTKKLPIPEIVKKARNKRKANNRRSSQKRTSV